MTTMIQVKDFVKNCSVDERAELLKFIAERRAIDALDTKYDLTLGDQVQFTSMKKRSPFTYKGKLVKKAQLKATIQITWANVPYPKYSIGSMVTVPFVMLKRA